MKLVVGLGNVGRQYTHHRHNAGFMVVDRMAELHSTIWKDESKLKASVSNFDHEGETIVLAKPTTMMNASGEAIQRLTQRYKLAPSDVWVIFDDVDTPYGRLRIRQGGSGSGHQGVNSAISAIGPNFIRVKFGISLNDRTVEPSEVYVLKPFNAVEQASLGQLLDAAAAKVSELLSSEAITAETYVLAN